MKIKFDLVTLDTIEFPVSHARLPGATKSLCGMVRGAGLRKAAGKAPECRVCAKAIARLQDTEDRRAAVAAAGVSVLTCKDANRLRGLIEAYGAAHFRRGVANAADPITAGHYCVEAVASSDAVHDELLRLTGVK